MCMADFELLSGVQVLANTEHGQHRWVQNTKSSRMVCGVKDLHASEDANSVLLPHLQWSIVLPWTSVARCPLEELGRCQLALQAERVGCRP